MIKYLVFLTIVTFNIIFVSSSFASFQGRYCEMDGASTESGESVTGECYIY